MSKLALKGLRIIDMSWVIAGPFASKILADFGAEVIKIESTRKVDGLRVVGPWKNGKPTPPNRSGLFDTKNVNKLSLQINLKTNGGIEIVKRLVNESNVLIDNFSAGTMDRLGLGYDVLSKINPKLIMISLSGFGQTGPYSKYVSFGPNIQAISGLTSLTGWPGRIPVGIGQAYPDFISSLFAVYAIMACLRKKDHGRGRYIDLSQYEGAVTVLGHSLLEYTVNNKVPQSVGNKHPNACPHGCYRCKGEDRWCVIAVFTDEEWKAFCKVLGNPDWTQRRELNTLYGRKQSEDTLNRLIEEWTITRNPEEVMEILQDAGVAAAVVQNVGDLITRDRHMRARGYYQEIEHPPIGAVIPEGIPFKLSLTPGSFRTPAPLLGEHNEYILKNILGMSKKEIDTFDKEGVFQ